MAVDGGRVAARGFQYQYLRTLEELVAVVDDPQVSAVRVEGPPADADADVVDFDVVDVCGRCLLAAQVKSKAPGGTVSASEGFGVLARLVRERDAAEYHLLTNAMPGPGAEELAAALTAAGPAHQLRAQLREVLRGGRRRLAELEALAPDDVERLRRARLLFDRRDEDEIRCALRERLRSYRNQARAGLGERSAGLLSGYLVSEVLRRAADQGVSVFTTQQFREHLLIDGDELARVAGVRDWGVIVGSVPTAMPDVDRPAVLARLTGAFSERGQRAVRRVVLTGPSGIGKSSLAAAYIADQADAYYLIFWVAGETEAALLTSYHLIVDVLRGPSAAAAFGANRARLRGAVHTELSRLPNRWLMVVDNVTAPRLLEGWIPVAGQGDVIVTSTDSAGRYGTAQVIEVGSMEMPEAVELLSLRLRLDGGDRDRYREELVRLARELECWPLAMELAAGYLDSCGIGLDHLDFYLSTLKNRSLSDPLSRPPGYPRTLGATVALTLDYLLSQADHSAEGMPSLLAYSIIVGAAYLAAGPIPVHLAAAPTGSFDEDEGDSRHQGPFLLHPTVFPLTEAVRELRRFSLATYDADLPTTLGPRLPDSERTITVNSVVQDLTRFLIDERPGTPSLLDSMAFHVERWLTSAMELGELDRAFILFTHADTLVGHLHRLEVQSERVGLLWGNLAAAYLAQGNAAKADELLRAEADFFSHTPHANELLVVQAKLILVRILFDTPGESSTSMAEAVAYLEHTLTYARNIAAEHPPAALKLAIDATSILARAGKEATDSAFAMLQHVFTDFISRLEPTPYSRAVEDVTRASQLLSADRLKEAEQFCRRAIDADVLGTTDLVAWRLLVEILACREKWDSARLEFEAFTARFGSTPLLPDIVSTLAHNVGLACALRCLFPGNEGPRALLAELLDSPAVSYAATTSSRGRRGRIRLLTAIRQLTEGHVELAESTLHSVRTEDLDEDDPVELDGWRKLWEFARLTVLREAQPLLEGDDNERHPFSNR